MYLLICIVSFTKIVVSWLILQINKGKNEINSFWKLVFTLKRSEGERGLLYFLHFKKVSEIVLKAQQLDSAGIETFTNIIKSGFTWKQS